MKIGIKWRGDHHEVTMESCPCCRKWVKVSFKGQTVTGLKHRTFIDDIECPFVKAQDANPMNRFQKLVFNYADLEDRMASAREALRRDEIREARLDGRKPVDNRDPNEVQSLGLTADEMF